MKECLPTFIDRLYKTLCQHQGDEILINGARGVFITTHDRMEPLDVNLDIDHCADLIRQLARESGLRIDARHPACGGSVDRLGLRWHALVNPVAQDEMIFSMRRHRFQEVTWDAFEMTAQQFDVISQSVIERRPLLVSGRTGVGKSTFLVSLLKKWHLTKRVVIIESIGELPSLAPSWIRLTEASSQVSGHGAFSLGEVAKQTLRLRPEVLVVGELRGDEAEVFIDMSLSGHGGCYATIHAGSPTLAMIRLKAMAPRAAKSLPPDFTCTVVQLERVGIGSVAVVDVVSLQINGMPF